jgi:glycosyltransferase involved in cell wall biosynthesis
MALGRPVIGTDAGGPREIVTDGVDGLLVPPGDAATLAAALERLIDDPEQARAMGQKARARSGEFGVERMVGGVLGLYEELLSPPRRRASAGGAVDQAG